MARPARRPITSPLARIEGALKRNINSNEPGMDGDAVLTFQWELDPKRIYFGSCLWQEAHDRCVIVLRSMTSNLRYSWGADRTANFLRALNSATPGRRQRTAAFTCIEGEARYQLIVGYPARQSADEITSSIGRAVEDFDRHVGLLELCGSMADPPTDDQIRRLLPQKRS